MQLSRYVGIVDLAIITVAVVAIALPPREMMAFPAQKGTDADRFELALAEARTTATPMDGTAVSELSRRLDEAGFKDWSIETAVHGAAHAKGSPTQWRALLAASVAYVDHLDVEPALDYATRALAACRDTGSGTCPSWEEIRMQLYAQHLDAGIKSGIDPHKDPAGFRAAGENGLRSIRLKNDDRTQQPSAAGSAGSAGSAATAAPTAPAGSAQP